MKKTLCLPVLLLLCRTANLSSSDHDVPIQPPLLKNKDKVAIIAPASKASNSEYIIKKATEVFQSWGLEVVLGKYVSINHPDTFAVTDVQRAADMQWALDDPNIKAIFSLRGGYGTTRIVDQLNFTCFLKRPKWVVGFSDITTLHIQLHKLGVVSVHGAMPVNFSSPSHKASVVYGLPLAPNKAFGNIFRISFSLFRVALLH